MTRSALLAACLCALSAVPAAARQRTPTAHCNDGTYYYGTSRRLACAHHRGVSEWLGPLSRSQLRSSPPRPAPKPRTPSARRPGTPRTPTRAAPSRPAGAVAAAGGQQRAGGANKAGVAGRAPSGATARCKDGTWSRNPKRAAACAGHRGIARWLGRR
jgi:hypothetical protein